VPPQFEPVDYTRYPELGREPFLCQSVSYWDKLRWFTDGFAADGHANPKSFCVFLPSLAPIVGKCLTEKNPAGAGFMYKEQVDTAEGQQGWGNGSMRWDSSYCFVNGMCDMPVSNSTTMEDAEKMCDAIVGHEVWTSFPGASAGWLLNQPPFEYPNRLPSEDHYTNDLDTKGDLISSCAMGNMHCDAMMCKETFCKDPKYIQEYGHYLKRNTYGKKAQAAMTVSRAPRPAAASDAKAKVSQPDRTSKEKSADVSHN